MSNEHQNWSEEASKIRIEPSSNLFPRIARRSRPNAFSSAVWIGIAAVILIGLTTFSLWSVSANSYGKPKQIEDLAYSPNSDQEFKNNEHLMRVYYRSFSQNFY